MKWFPGPYKLASQVSKKNGALLIVFLECKDEKGAVMSSWWDQVDSSLFTCPVVAVRMTSGTPEADLFTQSYPAPIIPVSMFIDNEGKLMDIITFVQETDPPGFIARTKTIVENFVARKASESTNKPEEEEAESSAPGSSLSLDEKVKRAKELLEEKRLKDEERKKAEEKEKELDRIRSGKMMQEAAQRRQEQELIEAAAQRRREKLAAEADKQRVMAQIRADREEREYRQRLAAGAPNEEEAPKPSENKQPVRVDSDRCRVQVRLPGTTTPLIEEFSSTEPLSRLADVLREENHVSGSFSLVQPYPRQVFSAEEMNKSFLDLCLTPSCTLAVELTRHSVSSVVSASPLGGIISLLSLLIFSPLQYAWTFIQSLIGGGGNSGRTAAAKKEDEPTTSAAGGDRPQQGIPRGATVRRRGNLAGLHNSNGDDDSEENANWNGNSTQYM